MDIRISGRSVDVGDAFHKHAREKLTAIADKYFQRSLSAQVTLSKDAHSHRFVVDSTMHVRQGIILKAEGKASDAHAALDTAVARIEKQLRRYSRRLKNHHKPSNKSALLDLELDSHPASYTLLKPHEEDIAEHKEDDAPLIIAETTTDIPTVSVADAVMLMDLRHTPSLFFKNSKNEKFSMVYRRSDGNIGWVEPRA